MFNFFFSSRRRHTRFDCDWSSDVCSSDLINNDQNIDIICSQQQFKIVTGRQLTNIVFNIDWNKLFNNWHKFQLSFDRDKKQDRKSTRLNSSHSQISYAVFCLKKKKEKTNT